MASFIEPFVARTHRPDKRRRGLGCGMISKALSLSFGHHSVDRVDLGVSATNLMAIGCYSKLGFAQVGLWSNAIVAGSRALDVVWMTLTRDRWAQSCAEPWNVGARALFIRVMWG